LAQLVEAGEVEVLPFPPSVLEGLRELTREVVEELAAQDPIVARVWQSCRDFMAQSRPWQRISEQKTLETGVL
jgi:TRAP-type mannitol/chloroaromatic compound transport system substrate-binding protein